MRANKCDLLGRETDDFVPDLFSFFIEWKVKRSIRYQQFITLLIAEPDRRLQALETPETFMILLRKNIRGTDLIAQIGDGEFAILLLESDLDVAYAVASRIMEYISSYMFDREEVQYLTVSIGAACFPTTSASLKTSGLLKEAKNALKVAKKEGNRVHFWVSL